MKCIECKWFVGNINDNYGICKRYPETANKNNHDWCGEYAGKAEVVSDEIKVEVKRGRKPKQ